MGGGTEFLCAKLWYNSFDANEFRNSSCHFRARTLWFSIHTEVTMTMGFVINGYCSEMPRIDTITTMIK
jgi:hypothetical protein